MVLSHPNILVYIGIIPILAIKPGFIGVSTASVFIVIYSTGYLFVVLHLYSPKL